MSLLPPAGTQVQSRSISLNLSMLISVLARCHGVCCLIEFMHWPLLPLLRIASHLQDGAAEGQDPQAAKTPSSAIA